MVVDFINNKFTVNHTVSTEALLNYSAEDIRETMRVKVAQTFGNHAVGKASLVQHRSPATASEEFTYSCYIFSGDELRDVRSYIEQLERENAFLKAELNMNKNSNNIWRL